MTMLTSHDLKKSLNPKSRRSWFGRRGPILSMNSLHERSKSTTRSTIWTITKRKGSLETPLEEIHELVTINRMTDDQPNRAVKGTKIPTVHDLWSWTPLSNNGEDRYPIKRKNDNDVKNSVSDVGSQDTCWEIANRAMEGHQNSDATRPTATGVYRLMLPKKEGHTIPLERWKQPS